MTVISEIQFTYAPWCTVHGLQCQSNIYVETKAPNNNLSTFLYYSKGPPLWPCATFKYKYTMDNKERSSCQKKMILLHCMTHGLFRISVHDMILSFIPPNSINAKHFDSHKNVKYYRTAETSLPVTTDWHSTIWRLNWNMNEMKLNQIYDV